MKKCTCTVDGCAQRKITIEQHPCTAVVQPSSIPEWGKGLFAERDYKRNEFVTYYSGTVTDVPIEGDRVLQINKRRWIDGSGSCAHPLAPGDFINHKVPANTRFCVSSHPLCLVKIATTKNVKKGSEFFINYGREYWQSPSVPETKYQ